MYYIGDITLVVNVPSIVIGIAAAVVCTTAVSVIVCMRSLHTKPATAMRPKAPKPGKRIVLEKITPFWKRLSFNSKLTARNLLRYKSRLFMTVIGVAGCTALIVAAFGLLNSFDPLTIDQFETIYKYNTVIVPEDSGTESELEYLTDTAENDADISAYMLMMQEEASVVCGSNVKDGDTTLVAVQSPENLPEIISLHTRRDGTELSLTDEGVLLNEKLADELDAEVGDMIELSSDSGTAEVKVTGIYEQYLYNYVYMTADLYSELYGSEACYNTMDVKLSDTSEEAKSAFSSEYLDDSRITAVTFIDSSLEDFENMLSSLDLVVIVMIICAAALAFVVLYNLTNINIAERVREIATFKVLGFHNGETSSFIYRENIVLTILGIAAGLILGNFLTGFIVQTVEVDNVMFGRDIYFTSYLCAAGLTALFALIVNAVMSIKIKSVNMVESLKSVE
ncbi:MAG: ABC transporter permease [Clostridiales bacterium]|nr:ABC transporter permease [Clostridiales bacterium]